MRYASMLMLLVSCLVFQGCVHHHARPHDRYDEPKVVHHVVTPAPVVRHEVRHEVQPHHTAPQHHAPKPHVVHARPDHKPQAHHHAPKAHKPESRPHSGNGRNENKHFGQPHRGK